MNSKMAINGKMNMNREIDINGIKRELKSRYLLCYGLLWIAVFILFLLSACKNDPEPFSATEPYANFTTVIGSGNVGSGDNDFAAPFGIALDEERQLLYVADFANNRIQVWDLSADPPAYNSTIGSGVAGDGDDQFDQPFALVLDREGDLLYITDANNGRIRVWDLSAASPTPIALGNILGNGASAGEFLFPAGLALDTAEDLLYVVDIGNNTIQVWEIADDLSSSTFYYTFGMPGFGPGRLESPFAALFDAGANLLYVSEQDNHRLQVFNLLQDPAAAVGFLGHFGSAAGQLNTPTGLALDKDNKRLYVSDTANNRLQMAQLPDAASDDGRN